MLFGVVNVLSTFQRITDVVAQDLPIVRATIIDFVTFSKSMKKLERRTTEVDERLNDRGLKITLSKCQFARPGHRHSAL